MLCLLLTLRLRPTSTLFPYTTLFRSARGPGFRRSSELARRTHRHFTTESTSVKSSVHTRTPPPVAGSGAQPRVRVSADRKSTRLNSSHVSISYAVFCLKKKKKPHPRL